MSVQVIWQPSPDPLIASYRIERAPSIGGPWSLLVNIAHDTQGPSWDPVNTYFFYNDPAGTSATYYRITSVDQGDQAGPPSPPFASTVQFGTGVAALVNIISIPAGDAATLLNLGYSTIEVYESHDEGASYDEITAPSFLPAFVSSAVGNTYGVGGLSLTFKANGGSPITVDFSSVIPRWTPQQVADRVNQVSPGVASVVDGAVVLSSVLVGRSSSIEVISSPGDMNFPSGRMVGKDVRLQLFEDAQLYTYYDVAGGTNSRYKWRFSNNGASPFSNFSTYVYGSGQAAVDTSRVSLATARFVSMDGRPMRQNVLIAPVGTPIVADGVTIGTDRTSVYTSDADGQLQIPLVKGLRVRVGIEGTPFVREFVVPDQPSFDLLQVMSAAPDVFTVQTVPPLLTRRSL